MRDRKALIAALAVLFAVNICIIAFAQRVG